MAGGKRGHGGAVKRDTLWEARWHTCRSYNVGCTFLSGDRAIATGSEDGAIWVYDTDTGHPRRALQGHTSVVHCVSAPASTTGSPILASCSIDTCDIHLWTPERGAPKPPPGVSQGAVRCEQDSGQGNNTISSPPLTRNRARELAGVTGGTSSRPFCTGTLGAGDDGAMPMVVGGGGRGGEGSEMPVRRAVSIGLRTETREEALQRAQRAAIEALMQQHGELMLRIFHTYDYSFRAAFNWQALLEHIRGVCEARGLSHEGAGTGPQGGGDGGGGVPNAVDERDPVAVINAVRCMAQDFAATLRQQQESIFAGEQTPPPQTALPLPLGLLGDDVAPSGTAPRAPAIQLRSRRRHSS